MPTGVYVRKVPVSLETRQKLSALRRGNTYRKGYPAWNKGMKMSKEHCEKLSKAHLGIKCPWNITRLKGKFGEESMNWKGGISLVKKENQRNDSAYQDWVRRIKRRDGKCKLENNNCSGYLIVHHILTWKDYPEERYNINNGITLCQGHHPRKRAEEKQLVPVFQKLVINTQ